MKTGFLARVSSILVLLFSTFSTVQAQQSFVVAGSLDLYIDLFDPSQSGATFTATVTYDPSVLLVNSLSAGMYEEVYFNEAVTQVEFAVFDSLGNEVLRRIEEGVSPDGKTTYIRALNDLVGGVGDELEYNAYGKTGTHLAEVAISFSESSGSLFSELTAVPEPPSIGEVDGTSVSFLLFEYEDGINLSGLVQAAGTITMIDVGETDDPYEECAEQANNHGEYVSCIAHMNNELLADGSMTGKDKGQSQKHAAKSKSKKGATRSQ